MLYGEAGVDAMRRVKLSLDPGVETGTGRALSSSKRDDLMGW